MENFRATFLERQKDVVALHSSKRYRAAMHFGGVTIECLLKSILHASLPVNANGLREWFDGKNAPGHSVYNPGHSYQKAISEAQRYNGRLKFYLEKRSDVQYWLRFIENPDMNFIKMRYSEIEPNPRIYEKWQESYKNLLSWLQQNARP